MPFALLLVSGLSFLLGSGPDEAARSVTALVSLLLPVDSPAANDLLRDVVGDILITRRSVTLYSAIGFAWFSTRLFSSLRSTLALCFDGTDRGIVSGKLFDLAATVVATVAVVAYVIVSAYVDLATTRGLSLLREVGLREAAMGGVGYVFGRLLALSLVLALFHALYRGLPRRRPPRNAAFIGALAATVMFEFARYGFSYLVREADPGSLYTGTIAAVVGVVFWTYYGSFLFLLGGEVAQAVTLRRGELAALATPPTVTPATRTAP